MLVLCVHVVCMSFTLNSCHFSFGVRSESWAFETSFNPPYEPQFRVCLPRLNSIPLYPLHPSQDLIESEVFPFRFS